MNGRAFYGTVTNNIEVTAARELGIAVRNVRGYCASSVPHVWVSLTQHVSDQAPAYRI
jgi:lactate dehydrogenase-like 2-hydroxyacid dehydrogenase